VVPACSILLSGPWLLILAPEMGPCGDYRSMVEKGFSRVSDSGFRVLILVLSLKKVAEQE
jgi:hypothetical protein